MPTTLIQIWGHMCWCWCFCFSCWPSFPARFWQGTDRVDLDLCNCVLGHREVKQQVGSGTRQQTFSCPHPHPQLPPQSPACSGLGHTQAPLPTHEPHSPLTGLIPHIQASLQQPLFRWPRPPCSWSLCLMIVHWPCCPRNGRTQRCTVPRRGPPRQHVCQNEGSAQSLSSPYSLGKRTEGEMISKRGQGLPPDTPANRLLCEH